MGQEPGPAQPPEQRGLLRGPLLEQPRGQLPVLPWELELELPPGPALALVQTREPELARLPAAVAGLRWGCRPASFAASLGLAFAALP